MLTQDENPSWLFTGAVPSIPVKCIWLNPPLPNRLQLWVKRNNMIAKQKRACNIFFDPTHFQEQTAHTYCFVWLTSHFCHVAKYNSRPIKCLKTLVPAKWQERTYWRGEGIGWMIFFYSLQNGLANLQYFSKFDFLRKMVLNSFLFSLLQSQTFQILAAAQQLISIEWSPSQLQASPFHTYGCVWQWGYPK